MRIQPVVVLLAVGGCCFGADATVERWDTCEIALRGGTHRDPFRDVRLSARFRHQSGRTVSVNGFYDGGSTWRLRFLPLELGSWTWETQSNDAALNAQRGMMQCVEPVKPYLHGPLRADGYHFVYADGTRPFLISTRLSCQYADPSVLEPVIAYLKESRVNRVLFMMPGVHGQSNLLYGGGGGDLGIYNVASFQAMDRFIDGFRRADILVSPYLYYFNDKRQKGMTVEQDEQYVRYVMARIGAYANVMPVLSNEVEQKFSSRTDESYDPRNCEWANRIGGLLKSLAVFGIPVAVHNPMENHVARNPGFFTLLRQWPFPWADFQLRQMQIGALGSASTLGDEEPEPLDPSFNARAFARQNALLIELRKHGTPVINEEPGYEMEGARSWNSQTATTLRATFWSAAMAGAYAMWGNPGTYATGDPLPYLKRSLFPRHLRQLTGIMDRVPYWEMRPANDLVSPNAVTIEGGMYRRNYLLAEPGAWYLAYVRDGGAVELQLEPGEYGLEVIRLTDVPGADPGRRYPPAVKATSGPVRISVASGWEHALILKRTQ